VSEARYPTITEAGPVHDQQEIDAVVTIWHVTAPAQAQRADVERLQPHQSRAFLPRLAWRLTGEA